MYLSTKRCCFAKYLISFLIICHKEDGEELSVYPHGDNVQM